MSEVIKLETAEKISAVTGYTPEEIAVLKSTVAKNTSNTELAYFLNVAKTIKLNPFNREIWSYKDNKGNLLVFAGRDGFLKKAQESPRWNGMTSFEVCENDDFEMDVSKGEIKHKPKFGDRGKIIGAYAIVWPKGTDLPTIEWAELEAYHKHHFVWNSHTAEMIKKVAETHALKKAFGITGLQSEYDFEIKNNVVQEIKGEDFIDKFITALDKYKGDDKEEIRQMCIEKKDAGEFTEDFAKNIIEQLGLKL